MKGKVLDSGYYELYESVRGRVVLVLNENQYYSWTRENKVHHLRLLDDISIRSGDHNYSLLNKGNYFIINQTDDRSFPNMPHLFLKHINHYDEYVLQNGLPDIGEPEKELIVTNMVVPAEEVDNFIFQKF